MRGEPREVLICENRLFVYAYFISNEMRSICELWIVSVCVGGRRHMSEIERHRFVLQLVRTHSAQYLIWFIGLTQSSRRRLLRCTHCRRPSCCYRHTMLPSSERYAYPLVVNWISSETVGQSMCRSMFGNWRCSHFIKIRQILASLRRTEGTWILLIFPKFCFNFWFFSSIAAALVIPLKCSFSHPWIWFCLSIFCGFRQHKIKKKLIRISSTLSKMIYARETELCVVQFWQLINSKYFFQLLTDYRFCVRNTIQCLRSRSRTEEVLCDWLWLLEGLVETATAKQSRWSVDISNSIRHLTPIFRVSTQKD